MYSLKVIQTQSSNTQLVVQIGIGRDQITAELFIHQQLEMLWDQDKVKVVV
jgi:hypothetical protein